MTTRDLFEAYYDRRHSSVSSEHRADCREAYLAGATTTIDRAEWERYRLALEQIAASGCVNAAPYCAGAARTANRVCHPCRAAAALAEIEREQG